MHITHHIQFPENGGGSQMKGEKGGWDSRATAGTLHAFGMHTLASRSDARARLRVTHHIQLPKDEGLVRG